MTMNTLPDLASTNMSLAFPEISAVIDCDDDGLGRKCLSDIARRDDICGAESEAGKGETLDPHIGRRIVSKMR